MAKHSDTKTHWEKELQKPSLKEAPLKPKFQWMKPLTIYHTLEFRGNFIIKTRPRS